MPISKGESCETIRMSKTKEMGTAERLHFYNNSAFFFAGTDCMPYLWFGIQRVIVLNNVHYVGAKTIVSSYSLAQEQEGYQLVHKLEVNIYWTRAMDRCAARNSQQIHNKTHSTTIESLVQENGRQICAYTDNIWGRTEQECFKYVDQSCPEPWEQCNGSKLGFNHYSRLQDQCSKSCRTNRTQKTWYNNVQETTQCLYGNKNGCSFHSNDKSGRLHSCEGRNKSKCWDTQRTGNIHVRILMKENMIKQGDITRTDHTLLQTSSSSQMEQQYQVCCIRRRLLRLQSIIFQIIHHHIRRVISIQIVLSMMSILLNIGNRIYVRLIFYFFHRSRPPELL